MLEALTIFTKGGLILYQYTASPSLVGADDGPLNARTALNTAVIQPFLLNGNAGKTFHISNGLSFVWQEHANAKESVATSSPSTFIVAAMYPDILFEGPRQYLRQWATILVQRVTTEYEAYCSSAAESAENAENGEGGSPSVRPDPDKFDEVFKHLLEQSKTQKDQQPQQVLKPSVSSDELEDINADTAAPTSKSSKEKRTWHDGNAKVTEKEMARLDKSGKDNAATADGESPALQEARQTYLPTEADLEEEDDKNSADSSASSSWSSSMTSLLQQLSGNKRLSAQDLERPLQSIQDLLVAKNVARNIAISLCNDVCRNLLGKKLNSLYRVQTAVRQSMEASISKLLKQGQEFDLLRAIYTKRGDGSLLSFGGSKKRPYVITVMGINGIGKTTSLAKLAYYLKENNCRPLLVAGDTFRSGAVEQLNVHAQCLEVPLFSQGYSKDPAAVASAAIDHAMENDHDVVLIDTAGRMQNNVPLMKALGKLVSTNKPDCCVFVCEALVGHDGLNQFEMFQQALGPQRSVDGLILTKFDTVGDKVGAALTLTHETKAPILFCGTGQKYHHLKKINVPQVIDSLFT